MDGGHLLLQLKSELYWVVSGTVTATTAAAEATNLLLQWVYVTIFLAKFFLFIGVKNVLDIPCRLEVLFCWVDWLLNYFIKCLKRLHYE